MQEVFEFLKACRTYFLATVENGQPRVRPFGSINLFEGRLYLQSKRGKAVAAQIAANPRVELCALNDKSEWVRVSGELVEDNRAEARQAMLDAFPSLKARAGADDGTTVLYYLKDASACFCKPGQPPRPARL